MTAGFLTCFQTPAKARAGLTAELTNRVPTRQNSTAEKKVRQERFLHVACRKDKRLITCASTGSSATSGGHKSRKEVHRSWHEVDLTDNFALVKAIKEYKNCDWTD